MNTKIVTYTGKAFDLLNPTPDMVCIEDIAHSLSLQCRYTGHVREFYSVAQHCVLMAEADLSSDPLQRLLHDASEAYIGDIARPWKRMLWVSKYRGIFRYIKDFEEDIQKVIGLALGIDLSYSAEVKEADNRMMATEVRDLMPPSDYYDVDAEPLEDVIVPQDPMYAEYSFLCKYRILMKERNQI